MSYDTTYYLLILMVVGFMFVDLGQEFLMRQMENVQTVKERKKLERTITMRNSFKMSRKDKLTKYQHTGFDFDGAQGGSEII